MVVSRLQCKYCSGNRPPSSQFLASCFFLFFGFVFFFVPFGGFVCQFVCLLVLAPVFTLQTTQNLEMMYSKGKKNIELLRYRKKGGQNCFLLSLASLNICYIQLVTVSQDFQLVQIGLQLTSFFHIQCVNFSVVHSSFCLPFQYLEARFTVGVRYLGSALFIISCVSTVHIYKTSRRRLKRLESLRRLEGYLSSIWEMLRLRSYPLSHQSSPCIQKSCS